MEFDDPELEPFILPPDARLSLRGPSEEFKTVFDRISSVAQQKEKISGTSLVYIVAEDSTVSFTASDGTQTVIVTSDKFKVLRDGKALLPAHKLKSISSLLPDPNTNLTVLAYTASIASGRAVWTVSIPADAKVPAVPDYQRVELHSVGTADFLRALHCVRKALPRQGGRKSLEQVHIAAGSATVSDGYRLLRRSIPNFPESLSVDLPKYTLDEFLRGFSSEFPVVELGADSSLIVAKYGSTVVVSRRLSLDYPDLESQLLAPALTNEGRLTVGTTELKDLITRVRVSADPEYLSVSVKTKQKSDGTWELSVSTRDRAGNSSSESLPVEWSGPYLPSDLSLNHRFLVDLLEAYPRREATLRLGENTKTKASPILLESAEDGFVGVLQQSVRR